MLAVWQLQEAKAKLTQLIKGAKLKPQIISRHGLHEVVVISIEEYKKLIGQKEDVVLFFRNSPLFGIDLELKRDYSMIREINL